MDANFVNALFGSKEQMLIALRSMTDTELPVIDTKYGEILGNREFLETAKEDIIAGNVRLNKVLE